MYRFHKTAVAAIFGVAALGLAGVAQAAFVSQTFTVDETQLGLGNELEGDAAGPETGYIFQADGFGGNYNELLTVDIDGSFDATAWWRANVFTDGLDTVDSNVRATSGNVERGYGLYVIFDSSGTLGPDGFTGDTGTIEFWLDPGRDTAFDFTSNDAADGVTVTPGTTDILVGSSTFLREADGTFDAGQLDRGSFALLFDEFVLTAEGSQYFVDPEPFFELLRVSGQFDTVGSDIVAGTERQSFTITNSSANGQFGSMEIPEPGIISLFGIGLLGLGLASRRRKAIES